MFYTVCTLLTKLHILYFCEYKYAKIKKQCLGLDEMHLGFENQVIIFLRQVFGKSLHMCLEVKTVTPNFISHILL